METSRVDTSDVPPRGERRGLAPRYVAPVTDGDSATLTLLRRWHGGDGAALDAILARHLPAIRDRVERRIGPLLRKHADVDDFVQDVVVRLLREGPRFEVADEEHFRMLLARVVENTLRDRHKWFAARRRSAAKERPLPASTVLMLGAAHPGRESPSRAIYRVEREAWVRLALDLLDDEPRELIVMREWEGLPFAEIGERIGAGEDAARMRYQRAVAKLAMKIGELRRGRIERACGEGT